MEVITELQCKFWLFSRQIEIFFENSDGLQRSSTLVSENKSVKQYKIITQKSSNWLQEELWNQFI